MLKKITSSLQNSPTIIIAMFLLTVAAGLMGIILGWNQFYNDFLSKTFSLPIWAALLIMLVIFTGAIFLNSSNRPTKPTELKVIEGKEFGVQRINLDGYHFKRCSFTGSELIFSGRSAFSLSNNSLSNFTITFEKEAATTLAALTSLHKDEGFRPIIEKTILNIQSGNHRSAPPTTSI